MQPQSMPDPPSTPGCRARCARTGLTRPNA